MAGLHFDDQAEGYARARPPYPKAVWELLADEGVIGPGVRVLEVGAGAGLATRPMVSAGSEVVAIEPGPRLADLLRASCPGVPVLQTRLEDASLEPGSLDSVLAATALHWVDLGVSLPLLHAALRPGGRIAVVRHRFGDPSAPVTPFRQRVRTIVAARDRAAGGDARPRPDGRPEIEELTAGGWFAPVLSRTWRWSVDLTADQVGSLFGTFSDWDADEVREVAGAARDLGGTVTEHYRTVLHLLVRVGRGTGQL